MCQIIWKPAGMTIARNLVESTCWTNADGFGYMKFNADSRDLEIEKLYNGDDNSPDVIFPIMEDLHDEDVFFHFRFRTRGPVDQNACHPFEIYHDNDRRVALMHNGTITGYGSSDKVDSQDYGERLIAPLYDTFLKSGERHPLRNQFFYDIARQFAGSDSKVVLLDNTGDYVCINQNKGSVLFDTESKKKYWVSNEYSFNRGHRKNWKVGNREYGANGYWEGNRFVPYPDDFDFNSIPWDEGEEVSYKSYTNYNTGYNQNYGRHAHSNSNSTGGASCAVNPPEKAQTSQQNQTSTETQEASQTGQNTSKPSQEMDGRTLSKEKPGELPMPSPSKSYWKDIAKLDSIEELLPITTDQIRELVETEPEHAVMFIRDLIGELWTAGLVDDEEEFEE